MVLSIDLNPEVCDPPITVIGYSLPASNIADPLIFSLSFPTKRFCPLPKFISLISLFKVILPSALSILRSLTANPEVVRLSSTFSLKSIRIFPSPETTRNNLLFRVIIRAFGSDLLTTFFDLVFWRGLKGRTPNLFAKSDPAPALGLILQSFLSALLIKFNVLKTNLVFASVSFDVPLGLSLFTLFFSTLYVKSQVFLVCFPLPPVPLRFLLLLGVNIPSIAFT